MSSRQQRDILAGIFTGAFATTLPFAISTSPRLNLAAARGGRAVGIGLGRGGRAIGISIRGGARVAMAGGRISRPIAARAAHVALKAGAKTAPVGGRFLGRSGAFTFRRVFVPVLKAEAVLTLFSATLRGSFRFGEAAAGGERGTALFQSTVTGFGAGLTGFSEATVRRELFGTTRGQVTQATLETGVRGRALETRFLSG